MRAMPVARRGRHAGYALQSLSALVRAIEIVSRRTVYEKDQRLRALRSEIKRTGVRSGTDFEERVVKPDLLFDGKERARLLASDRSGNRVEGIQSETLAVQTVIEKCGVKNVLGVTFNSSRRRLSPAHSSAVFCPPGRPFTTSNVCCKLTDSENQKRPRTIGPENVNRGYQLPRCAPS